VMLAQAKPMKRPPRRIGKAMEGVSELLIPC
jgi:hypothetical protein